MSYDTPIIDWLPDYWNKGPSVNLITFRQLLNHTSGLAFENTSSRSDYEFMQEAIAAGTTHLDHYSYQNVNYGLCRILMSTIDGTIPPDWFGEDPDVTWDLVTISGYQAYVQANVFAPSAVTCATLDHESADALAYNLSGSGNGRDFVNTATAHLAAGGGAWWPARMRTQNGATVPRTTACPESAFRQAIAHRRTPWVLPPPATASHCR